MDTQKLKQNLLTQKLNALAIVQSCDEQLAQLEQVNDKEMRRALGREAASRDSIKRYSKKKELPTNYKKTA